MGSPHVVADETNGLTPAIRKLLTSVFEKLLHLERLLGKLNREIEALAAISDVARRLMTILGIGALGATPLLAAGGNLQCGREAALSANAAKKIALIFESMKCASN